MKDGWHVCAGYDVWVEDGKVMRGISKDHQFPVYVYKVNLKGGWDNVSGEYSLDTVRKGMVEGRYIIR